MKFKTQWNIIARQEKFQSVCNSSKLNSLTIPDQSDKIRDIIIRSQRGQPVNIRQGFYHEISKDYDISLYKDKYIDITEIEDSVQEELLNLIARGKAVEEEDVVKTTENPIPEEQENNSSIE